MTGCRRRDWKLIDLIFDGFVGIGDVFIARFMCTGCMKKFVWGLIFICYWFIILIGVFGLLQVVELFGGSDELYIFCWRAFGLNFFLCIIRDDFASLAVVKIIVFTDSLRHSWNHKITNQRVCYSLIGYWGHIDGLGVSILRLNDGSVRDFESTTELGYFLFIPWNKHAFVTLEYRQLVFIKVHDVVLVFNFDVVHLFVFWKFLNFFVFLGQSLFERCHLVFKWRNSDFKEFYLILLVFEWGFALW